jgi:hypothetical protein
LAFNIAKRPFFSGQAVRTRGLSFAFFPFCSLLVQLAAADAAHPSLRG